MLLSQHLAIEERRAGPVDSLHLAAHISRHIVIATPGDSWETSCDSWLFLVLRCLSSLDVHVSRYILISSAPGQLDLP